MEFKELVQQIIDEQGIAVLENSNRCKILLYAYAKGGFKKEIRTFLHSLELGCYHELFAAKEPEPIKHNLIRQLQDEYMLTQDEAVQTIALLESVIADQKATNETTLAELEHTAQSGDYHAQYALGSLFEKLRRYPAAIHWFKEAAKHYADLKPATPEPSAPPPEPEVSKPESVHISAVSEPPRTADDPAHIGFVKIEGGNFVMGSPEIEPERIENEVPHEVTVSSFYMGVYEVTQQEYENYSEMNPSHFKGSKLPVENVNWFDAITYCNARSVKEGLIPAYTIKGELIRWNRTSSGYRLPTEAEWEYACRAQTATPFNTGTAITTDQANYDGTYPYNDCPKGTYREKTTLVGSFPPNPWGLYDMHGNVWEWCWDWYSQYDTRRTDNPSGPSTGTNRVIRGGSWGGGARYLRTAYRCGSSPFARDNYLGFRLVLPWETPKP
ncbi:MAG: formylglycine-generating enzyme family protein [Spirochaetaceae bacterium]|jgi:formylglycine-generating enzyme required for sulfatase activity|nr:formylglycine-generating enzyme family protein [Spirochaetaceae bacterium]